MRILRFIEQPKVQRWLAFLAFCFWIGLTYQKTGVGNKLDKRPQGEHFWAQVDRASLALTYYKDKAPFLLPRCHRTNGDPEGITAGEFPLIPYCVSKLYAWWGFHEIYHRLFVLGISLAGFLFAYLLARRLIASPLWAMFVAALWILSPNIIYYSITFLPDTPALALLTIALYFLLRNPGVIPLRDYAGFAVFFSLAALIKLSSAFPGGAIAVALFLTEGKKKMPGWRNKIFFFLSLLLPALLTIAWVEYSRMLLRTHHNFIFLMKPLPPKSWADFSRGMQHFWHTTHFYYPAGFFWLLGIATLTGLPFIRRSRSFLLVAALFTYVAFCGFFLLMFEKSYHHYYYWVSFHIGVFFHVAWLVDLLLRAGWPRWVMGLLLAAAMLLLNVEANHVAVNFKNRWSVQDAIYKPYNELEPRLDALGITYGDRIFSYQEYTFNATLYLMNRKGWTGNDGYAPEDIKAGLNICDYAVLNDTAIVENPEFKPYFYRRITQLDNLVIYELNAHERTNSRTDSP